MEREFRYEPDPMPRPLSPVLLLGGGAGEATCGILYLASHLRRHGIEAYVRLWDGDEDEAAVEKSIEQLINRVKPKLIGLSLKWFHHAARTLIIARTIRRVAPDVHITVGGNSASFWWKELLAYDCFDSVILGDGEVPLTSLARGDLASPNVLRRGTNSRGEMTYIQSPKSDEIHYSHFRELFLSELDLASYSGWVQPGKGCSENCLYCSGTRGMQKASFGRAKPFLRSAEAVHADHLQIVDHTWQLRYDFAGSTAAFLEQTWGALDFSRHSVTYFLWGVPPPELASTLSRRFQKIYMVLDIGCFSEAQRLDTMSRGLLKPCPTNDELMQVIERCQSFPNIELEVSGIAGLPYSTRERLGEERELVERVLQMGCSVGYQRLQAQPGALVTEHPDRFGMVTQARTFTEFLDYFEQVDPSTVTVPMIHYADEAFEAEVQATSDACDELVFAAAEAKQHVNLKGNTRLLNRAADTREVSLGDWLGSHRAPAKVAKEVVTVVRSSTGNGLSCAPTVQHKKFSDPLLQQGDEARALLDVLSAFEKAKTVDAVVKELKPKLPPDVSREVIEYLAVGRFLQPTE